MFNFVVISKNSVRNNYVITFSTFLYNLPVTLLIIKILLLTYCVCFCTPYCMVLSYVQPHNNLSTCATGCLLLSAFVFSGSQFPLFLYLFLLLLIILCKPIEEIKGFAVAVPVAPK